jgi:hypothetical protein
MWALELVGEVGNLATPRDVGQSRMKRLAVAVVVLVGLVAVSCTSGGTATRTKASPPTIPPPASGAAAPTPDIPPDARAVAGGCGATVAYRGAIPAWLNEATGNNAPDGLPYVIAAPAMAAGFIFGNPLRAGHPANPANKILWVVRTPREGAALQITVRPVAAAAPVLHQQVPANSGPGEIYPSVVDVPTAGCWHVALRWRTGAAELDLRYVAP